MGIANLDTSNGRSVHQLNLNFHRYLGRRSIHSGAQYFILNYPLFCSVFILAIPHLEDCCELLNHFHHLLVAKLRVIHVDFSTTVHTCGSA